MRSFAIYGPLAQLGEHRSCKPEVAGSNPVGSTKSARETLNGVTRTYADLAQLEELLAYTEEVGSSNLSIRTSVCVIRL